MSFPVKVWTYNDNGKTGYDLAITDEQATVQDYINAMNQAIETLPFTLHRKKGLACAGCAGCARCCQDVIQLTWIDVMLIRKQLDIDLVAHIQVSDRRGEGPFIGIILREEKDGFCSFLDRETHLCTIYPVRPLICQVYVCCLSTPGAKKVRDCIVGKGQDDLIRHWSIQAQEWGSLELHFHNKEKGVNVYYGITKDCPPNAFSGKSQYNEVLLKDLLPAELWEKVYKPFGRDRHNTWPVVMSVNKAAQLLGVDRKTLKDITPGLASPIVKVRGS